MFTQRVEAEAVLLADVEALDVAGDVIPYHTIPYHYTIPYHTTIPYLDVAGDVIPLEPVLRVPKVSHRAVLSGDRLAKVVWFTYALGLYM